MNSSLLLDLTLSAQLGSPPASNNTDTISMWPLHDPKYKGVI